MKIKRIKMAGFKGYKEEIVFNFQGNFTMISGPNGIGKTTIPEGISWCLYGCNLDGNDKVDSKLLNKESTEMLVEVEVTIENIDYLVSRSRKKAVVIKVNDTKVTQKELDKLIPGKDLFLSIFNPKYFLNLTPTKARARLITMLPKIYPLSVLEKYNDLDKNKIISKHQKDINNGIVDIGKKIKVAQDNINIKAGERNTYIQLKEEVEESIKEMDIEVFISDDELALIEELENKMTIEKNKKYIGGCSKELELKLQMLNNKYMEISTEEFKSDNSSSINEMELELATMRGQYSILLRNLNEARELGSKCNSCGQSISQEFKNTQINSIESQIENIKSLANGYHKSIDMIKGMDLVKKEEFDKNKNDNLKSLSEEMNSIKIDIQNLDKSNKEGERRFLELREMALGELMIQLDWLVAKRQTACSIKAQVDINSTNLIKYTDMIIKVNYDIEELKVIIEELTSEKLVLIDYNLNYVKFIAEIFEGILTDTKIHIHKLNRETGEIKEDFFITYKGKEYSLLSNSERIKVGLELANMFNVLLNREYPTVVDDSESILEIPTINTQMIVCRVKDIDNISIE